MSKTLIAKTADYVKKKLYNDASGHDWYHVERVWNMAKFLQAREGGDLEVIELAALLHNVGDHSDNKFHPEKGPLILFGMMEVLDIDEPIKSKVINVVKEMQFVGTDTKQAMSIEGKIVQDANFLDTLGAIGVARQLASGGFHGRPIYDPETPVREKLTAREYQFHKRKGTSINNFYEKSFRIAKLMNTAAAKKIAAHRIKYLEEFIAQFMKEWNGKDQAPGL